MNKDGMTDEKSLADILAAQRASGNVGTSTRSLFPPPELPRWKSLRLDWHVRLLRLFLGLHLISLLLIWAPAMGAGPFVSPGHMERYFAAAAIYLLLLGTAGAIQSQLHAAELQKHGGMSIVYFGLFLNPLFFGWGGRRVRAVPRRRRAPPSRRQ